MKTFKNWKQYAAHLISLQSTSKFNKTFYKWSIENDACPFTNEELNKRIIEGVS